MKMRRLYLFGLACFFMCPIMAQDQSKTQPKQTNNTTPAKTTAQNPPQRSLSAQTDSLKSATDDLKKSFNHLFGNKRDTIIIAIANVEFDDSNLTQLKEQLKKVKGVKNVMMKYKASSAMLEVSFKGKATDLWDTLPQDSRSPFRIVEAGETTLMLEPRK